MRFDIPYLLIALLILVSSISSAALFFVGVPSGINIGKQWFIIFAAGGFVAFIMFLKIALKPNDLEAKLKAAAPKPKMQSSLKKQPAPAPVEEEVEEPSDGRFTRNVFGNQWDDAFEKAQGVSVEDEEEADPPDYDRYFDPPKKGLAVEERIRARNAQLSQGKRGDAVTSESPPASKPPILIASTGSTVPHSEPADVSQATRSRTTSITTGSGAKPSPGISSISYVPASSMASHDEGEKITMVGSSFYFEDIPEIRYFRTSVFKPKIVDFKSTPDDPNSKASMKLFGVNLKVTSKPKIGTGAPMKTHGSYTSSYGSSMTSNNIKLEDIRKKLNR